MRHIADHSINHVDAYVLYGGFSTDHIFSLKKPYRYLLISCTFAKFELRYFTREKKSFDQVYYQYIHYNNVVIVMQLWRIKMSKAPFWWAIFGITIAVFWAMWSSVFLTISALVSVIKDT